MRLLDPTVHIRRRLELQADPARLQAARDWAGALAAEAGLDEPTCFQIRLAMSEAVGNAICHGSPEPGGAIEIEAFVDDGELAFEIRDTGTFVAPLARATIEDEGGRGLELLSLMMDEVEMTSSTAGSRLRFVKRIG